MLADTETTTTATEMAKALVFTADGYSDADGVDHVAVASRAVERADEAEPSHIPALANAQRNRQLARHEIAVTAPRLTLAGWTDRPANFQPHASWQEAHSAWAAAYCDWTDAFRANRNLSAPFIADPATDALQKHHYIFSRSADERVARSPDLPADLVASDFREEAARDALEVARQRAIQTPASGREILQKLRFITGQMDDVFDPLEDHDVAEARVRPDHFSLAIEFLALNDDLVRALPAPTSESAAWDKAFRAWEAAKAVLHPAQHVDRLATEEINRQAPAHMLRRNLHQDYIAKWGCRDHLDADYLVPLHEKARLLSEVEAWDRERSRLLGAKFGVDDDAWCKMHDDVDDASKALMDTQAPGLPELIVLQRIAAERLSENDHDSPGGFDNLGWVSFTDESFWTVSPVTAIHRQTLRLAGVDHPILHMGAFSPTRWIKAYEATGLKVGDHRRGLVLTLGADDDHAEALRAELASTPWKCWAVHLAANERRDGGGDPFCDSMFEYGARDNRGGRNKFYGHVECADLIEFSRDPHGGTPIPHFTRIDNRVAR